MNKILFIVFILLIPSAIALETLEVKTIVKIESQRVNITIQNQTTSYNCNSTIDNILYTDYQYDINDLIEYDDLRDEMSDLNRKLRRCDIWDLDFNINETLTDALKPFQNSNSTNEANQTAIKEIKEHITEKTLQERKNIIAYIKETVLPSNKNITDCKAENEKLQAEVTRLKNEKVSDTSTKETLRSQLQESKDRIKWAYYSLFIIVIIIGLGLYLVLYGDSPKGWG